MRYGRIGNIARGRRGDRPVAIMVRQHVIEDRLAEPYAAAGGMIASSPPSMSRNAVREVGTSSRRPDKISASTASSGGGWSRGAPGASSAC